MSNDITGGLRNLKGGNIDALWGPYATVAAANLAIPNTAVDGVNFREGKKVAIGTAIDYKEYIWKNGFANINLVEALSEYLDEEKSRVLFLRNADVVMSDDVIVEPVNFVNRALILKGNYFVDGAGLFKFDSSTNNWIRYPVVSGIEGDKIRIRNTILNSGNVLAIFLNNINTVISTVTASGLNNQDIVFPPLSTKVALNLAAKANIAITPNLQDNEVALVVSAAFVQPGTGVKEIKGQGVIASYLADGISYEGGFENPKTPVTVEYFAENQNKQNLMLDGVGFPDMSLGYDTNKYLDTKTGRIFLKKNGEWGQGYSLGGRDQEMAYPADFPWQPVTFLKQSNGWVIPSIIDIEVFVKSHLNTLTKGYVNCVSGSDSNDGASKNSPVKSVTRAYTLGYRLVILADGFYGRIDQMNIITDTYSQPFLLVAENTGKVSFGGSENATAYTWTKEDNVYKTGRTNLGNVIDKRFIDERGIYVFYAKKATLTEVKSTSKTWCYVGGVIYINTADGLQPGNDIEVLFTNVTQPRFIMGANTPYFYASGINFYNINGDSQLNIRNNTTTQYNGKVYVKNCGFNGNILGNGLAIDNIKEVWVQNCGGGDHLRDTLNYHTSLLTSGYIPSKIVEINGYSRRTGQGSTETSSNGSTAHEGSTIIRIQGDFGVAKGPVVADVAAGTMSLNINVKAFDSNFTLAGSFQCEGAGSKMWLLGCEAYGSPRSAKAVSGATIYYDSDTKLSGPTEGDVVGY